MSAFPALGYADIINGDLHHALDAFHASLECGNDKAVEGIAMLSTLPPKTYRSLRSNQSRKTCPLNS